MGLRSKSKSKGFTLLELMIAISILGVVISTVSPHFDIILRKAYQAKAKGNLAAIRSAMKIYFSENERWPMSNYPEGNFHYADGNSLTSVLVPNYISSIESPKVYDRMTTFNGLTGSFDESAGTLMALVPTYDVYILWGNPDYTPLLNSPYCYDNQTGYVYIPNGNYDTMGNYIYTW